MPHFYSDDFQDTTVPQTNGTYGKPAWFDKVKSEYWACRAGVGLIDMSTFTKFDLRVCTIVLVLMFSFDCLTFSFLTVGRKRSC
jgi:pyruvate dehydrogenase phosphatase regulatory subunit